MVVAMSLVVLYNFWIIDDIILKFIAIIFLDNVPHLLGRFDTVKHTAHFYN